MSDHNSDPRENHHDHHHNPRRIPCHVVGAPGPRDPAVRSQRLAAELSRIRRDDARMLGAEAAKHLGWSQSKLSRIERGVHGVSLADLSRLLDVYEVPGGRRDNIMALARDEAGRRRPSAGRRRPADDREDASVVLEWAPLTIPRLLQTADYARAVLVSTKAITPITSRTITSRVAATLRWQERLAGGGAPLTLKAVVGEAALHRRYGSAAVQRGQLERLLDLAGMPDVELRVLPLAGGGPDAGGAFTYVQFAPVHGLPMADAVLIGHLHGVTRLDGPAYLYGIAFGVLRSAAATADETAWIIRRVLAGVTVRS